MRRSFVAILALVVLPACHQPVPAELPAGLTSPYTGFSSPRYRQAKMWVCRPGVDGDPCLGDLSTTEIDVHGKRTVRRFPATTDPGVDCFYVYPTMNMSLWPGNDDLSDTRNALQATLAQAARFRTVCRVFAPLYRQVTIATYGRFAGDPEPRFRIAYSDVDEAFLHYLGQYNGGRKIVLIGHSQGAEMVARLLRRRFDDDPVLRKRLVAALVIGGIVSVPKGRLVGGTFSHVPICSSRGENGCVVAYRSFPGGGDLELAPRYRPPSGQVTACVNPAGVDTDGPVPLSGSLFRTNDPLVAKVPGVTTRSVLVDDAYAARCVDGPDGFRYLAITRSNAGSVHPLDLGRRMFRSRLGLHIYDYALPAMDLISLVRDKIAASGRL